MYRPVIGKFRHSAKEAFMKLSSCHMRTACRVGPFWLKIERVLLKAKVIYNFSLTVLSYKSSKGYLTSANGSLDPGSNPGIVLHHQQI